MLAKQFLIVAAMAAGAMAESIATAIDGTIFSTIETEGVGAATATAGAPGSTYEIVSTVVGTRTGSAVRGAATATARAGSTGHAGAFTTIGTRTGSVVSGTRAGSVFVTPTSTRIAYLGGDGLVFASAPPGGLPCSTLLSVDCYSNGLQNALYCAQAVNFGVPHVTMTVHPYGLEASNLISTRGEIRSVSVGCEYFGYNSTNSLFSSEVCTVSLSASVEGLTTRRSTVITSTTPITKQRVIVTAGATYLPPISGTCTRTPGAAVPTALPGAWKVVVPGAAIAAGMAML